jgi:NOL1/NOP2/fmu family ribosome biogenesis protein
MTVRIRGRDFAVRAEGMGGTYSVEVRKRIVGSGKAYEPVVLITNRTSEDIVSLEEMTKVNI